QPSSVGAVRARTREGVRRHITTLLRTHRRIKRPVDTAVHTRYGGLFGPGGKLGSLLGENIAQDFRGSSRKDAVAGGVARKIRRAGNCFETGNCLDGPRVMVIILGIPT